VYLQHGMLQKRRLPSCGNQCLAVMIFTWGLSSVPSCMNQARGIMQGNVMHERDAIAAGRYHGRILGPLSGR